MKITITHSGFHGTTTCAIEVSGQPGERVRLSAAQSKKLDRAACGARGCQCGENIIAELMIAEDPYWSAFTGEPAYITIPTDGSVIALKGKYPQR